MKRNIFLFLCIIFCLMVFCFTSCMNVEDSVILIVLDSGALAENCGFARTELGNTKLNSFTPISDLKGGTEILGYYSSPDLTQKVLNSDGSFASDNVAGFIEKGRWINKEDCILYPKFNGIIGGRIFYVNADSIHNADGTITIDDVVYTFYNKNGKQIKDFTNVPTSAGQVTGLADACYYTVSDKPEADYFYVAYSIDNAVSFYPNENATSYQWGNRGIYISGTDKVFGSGKNNTKVCLDASVTWSSGSATERESIFHVIKTMNSNSGTNGCSDWYVGSIDEMTKLFNTGLISLTPDYSDGYVATSSEDNSVYGNPGQSAHYLGFMIDHYYQPSFLKDATIQFSFVPVSLVPIRSF